MDCRSLVRNGNKGQTGDNEPYAVPGGRCPWVTVAERHMDDRASMPPEISVIVPVRNNPEGVAALLACLEAQTLAKERFEVIVWDDGSRPGQVPQVNEDGAGGRSRIQVIKGARQNSYSARNAASLRARGSILAFCDSDCEPDPRWLEEGLAALDAADLIAGQVIFAPPARPSIWSLLTIDMFLDQERDVRQSSAVTANLLVDREWFDKLQGFDQSLSSGGDYDFVYRALVHGARVEYSPLSLVRHPTMNTAKALLEKVWFTNYWAGVRGRSRPEKDAALSPRLAMRWWMMLPFAGTIAARVGAGRPPFKLYAPRLQACGITATFWDNLRAGVLIHFVICYVAGLARVMGARRVARRPPAPVYNPAARGTLP